MNYNDYFSLVLLVLSLGFAYFSYEAKVYQVSKLAFVHYSMVFFLALLHDLLKYHLDAYVYFYLFHAFLLGGSVVFMVEKLYREWDKYKYVITVLLGSIVIMFFSFWFLYHYFLWIHFGLIVFNLFYVAGFILYREYSCGKKRRRKKC
jgi:hypothetical protein